MGGNSEGLTLGRYTILREIASGGMATVYLARQQGPVGFSKPVALKRMHPHIAKDPDFSTMFYDEATLAARIQHPNVVATLDVVAHEDEVFIVMEYVNGGSLATMIRDRHRKRIQVDIGIAASIMCEVLAGLHAAHEATNDAGKPLKIVHRDISPQNVLIGRDGLARVVDFGVAKAAVRSGVTKDQGVKGKLCYMSPEQVSGQDVDRRADIFAAAAVLFELLAGRRLFRGDDPGALIGAVIMAKVPPMSDFRDDIPPNVEAAMRRALEPNPDDRFPTALAFADALEDAVTKLPSRRRISAWVEQRAVEVALRRVKREAKRETTAATAPNDASPQATPTADVPAPTSPNAGPPQQASPPSPTHDSGHAGDRLGEGGTAVMPDPRLEQPSIPEPIVDRMSDPGPDPDEPDARASDPPQVATGDTGNPADHASGPIVPAPITSGPGHSEHAPSESLGSEMMTTPYSQVSVAAGTSVSLPSPAPNRSRAVALVGAVASLVVVGLILAWVVIPSEEPSPASATETGSTNEVSSPVATTTEESPDEAPPEATRATPEPTSDDAAEATGPDDAPTPKASTAATSAPSASAAPGQRKTPSKTPPAGGTTTSKRPVPRPPPGGSYLPDMP